MGIHLVRKGVSFSPSNLNVSFCPAFSEDEVLIFLDFLVDETDVSVEVADLVEEML